MLNEQIAADPRHRNKMGDCRSLSDFASGYAKELAGLLSGIPASVLEAAAQVIATSAERRRQIFTIGNGGSAAMADHICCDLVKGTATDKHPNVRVTSLVSNVALYSAAANDFSFEDVFSAQIRLLAEQGDVLIAISSSGNSENILRGVAAAREKGMSVIGLCGFEGGRLKSQADIVVHAPAQNYGLVEDVHMASLHIIAQIIAMRRDGMVNW